jgi:hypothetical protein
MTDQLDDGRSSYRFPFFRIIETIGINRFKTQSEVVFEDQLLQAELFAFDSGQAITQPESRAALLIQVIDGEFEVSVADESVKVVAGGLVHAMANLRQSVFCRKAGHLILFRLRTERPIFGWPMGLA